jgi:malate dehydrogenase (oxaloacetate-decarboxylating)
MSLWWPSRRRRRKLSEEELIANIDKTFWHARYTSYKRSSL